MKNKIELMYSPLQGNLVNEAIMARISDIFSHQQFIMGPEVKTIEHELASFSGAGHAIACANGTDALSLALMSYNLKPDEVVFVPNFTYTATPECICLLGGVPYFVDVQQHDFNICPISLESSIIDALNKGLKIRGVISVDLFGNPCDYDSVSYIAKKYNLFFISDAAQSFGAEYKGKKVGSMADITTTSFFPTKPLGCYGDGGMLFTNDNEKAELLRSLTQHGKGKDKYHIERVGMNSRLDTIQAAVLLEKIKHFPAELEARNNLADYYGKELDGILPTPKIHDYAKSSWAVYNLRHRKRDHIIQELKSLGIPSNIYYPLPLNMQPAYNSFYKAQDLKNSQAYSAEVFCLPMHGYVSEEEKIYIIEKLKIIIGNLNG